jgi:hypothetical protein
VEEPEGGGSFYISLIRPSISESQTVTSTVSSIDGYNNLQDTSYRYTILAFQIPGVTRRKGPRDCTYIDDFKDDWYYTARRLMTYRLLGVKCPNSAYTVLTLQTKIGKFV